jgi:hypothetical protein
MHQRILVCGGRPQRLWTFLEKSTYGSCGDVNKGRDNDYVKNTCLTLLASVRAGLTFLLYDA